MGETERIDSGRLGRRITLLITNAIKLSGLIISLYEIFSQEHPPTLVLILAAFMMAGAQFSEERLLALASHLFGTEEPAPPPPPPPPSLPLPKVGEP